MYGSESGVSRRRQNSVTLNKEANQEANVIFRSLAGMGHKSGRLPGAHCDRWSFEKGSQGEMLHVDGLWCG